MPIPAAVIPAIGSLVDSTIGGLFQGAANRKNRKFQEKMYHWQRADALADWNMQNEYNSPGAQMARLKEAGLNPNLVYGNGGSQVQAATVRSASATQGQEQPLTGTRLGEAMRQYQDVQLANAQLTAQKLIQENLRQDIANKQATEQQTKVATANSLMGLQTSKFDLDRKRELALQIIEDAWAGTNLKKAQTDATVHGNQRAEQMQGQLMQEKQIEIANKNLQGAMQLQQNNQYDKMRPIQLAQAKAEVDKILADIKATQQGTLNVEQQTRLNKMEADAGRVLNYIKTIIGGKR